VLLHPREELVVDVAARVRDRVGVFQRDLLRVAEERARRVVVERLDLLRREAEPAAPGSVGVLSELATVPPGHATIEERPERAGHALRVLLEGGPHPLGGAEERRVARVEEVGIERGAPELALFVQRVASAARLAWSAVAWLGGIDAEGLPKAASAERGDEYGVAALHPLQPAEIEEALGDRRP